MPVPVPELVLVPVPVSVPVPASPFAAPPASVESAACLVNAQLFNSSLAVEALLLLVQFGITIAHAMAATLRIFRPIGFPRWLFGLAQFPPRQFNLRHRSTSPLARRSNTRHFPSVPSVGQALLHVGWRRFLHGQQAQLSKAARTDGSSRVSKACEAPLDNNSCGDFPDVATPTERAPIASAASIS